MGRTIPPPKTAKRGADPLFGAPKKHKFKAKSFKPDKSRACTRRRPRTPTHDASPIIINNRESYLYSQEKKRKEYEKKQKEKDHLKEKRKADSIQPKGKRSMPQGKHPMPRPIGGHVCKVCGKTGLEAGYLLFAPLDSSPKAKCGYFCKMHKPDVPWIPPSMARAKQKAKPREIDRPAPNLLSEEVAN